MNEKATFNGSSLVNKSPGVHFGSKDLEKVAQRFCDSLLDYLHIEKTEVGCVTSLIVAVLYKPYHLLLMWCVVVIVVVVVRIV